MSSTKRNRLTKRNAILILESSTCQPFKWHRQNYLCFYCHKMFDDTATLFEHTKLKHANSNVKAAVSYLRRDEKVKIDVSHVSCNCGTKMEGLKSLIEHLKTAHSKLFDEGCDYGVIPYNLSQGYQCHICNQEFKYFSKLNQHMNSHFGSYICEACGKSFLSQDRLRCHALRHGGGFPCKSCAEVFDSLTKRIQHEAKIHNKVKSVKCIYCEEMFQNYSLRKKHHNSAHNIAIPVYKCPVCAKVFHLRSKMETHVKEVHERVKNFPCAVCDQKFFSTTHVQKHMIKHFGERIFSCDVCGKSYARKQTLKNHMRIHNNDRRFVCTICRQSFVQSNSLKLHRRVHHPDDENCKDS